MRNEEIFRRCYAFYVKCGKFDAAIHDGIFCRSGNARHYAGLLLERISGIEEHGIYRRRFVEVSLDALSASRQACDWFRCHVLGLGPGPRFPKGCMENEQFRSQANAVYRIAGGALRRAGLSRIKPFAE
jgi:hypothetical protein